MNESPTDSPTDKDFSASYAPPGGRRSRPALLRYVGLCVFLVSFFLPALGGLGGFQSAFFGIIFVRPWQPDDKISSLAAFGEIDADVVFKPDGIDEEAAVDESPQAGADLHGIDIGHGLDADGRVIQLLSTVRASSDDRTGRLSVDFYQRARENAERADLVVVNHALLLTNSLDEQAETLSHPHSDFLLYGGSQLSGALSQSQCPFQF